MRTEPASCCGPSRADSELAGVAGEGTGVPHQSLVEKSSRPPLLAEMVSLDGGAFLMGAEGPETISGDREGPVREVEVDAFWIDPCAVSNRRFAAFAEATGYVTDVRLRRPAPRRVPGHPRCHPGAVVAPGLRCLLAPTGGPAIFD
jgi:formylglycine-generating enzyme required for sulfatase activity